MKNWLVDNKQIYQDNNSENLFLNDINLALVYYNNNNNNISNNNNNISNNINNYSGKYDFETKYETNIESAITCRVMSNMKKNSSDPHNIYTNKRQDYYSSSSRKFMYPCRNESYPEYMEEYKKTGNINYKKKKCVIF